MEEIGKKPPLSEQGDEHVSESAKLAQATLTAETAVATIHRILQSQLEDLEVALRNIESMREVIHTNAIGGSQFALDVGAGHNSTLGQFAFDSILASTSATNSTTRRPTVRRTISRLPSTAPLPEDGDGSLPSLTLPVSNSRNRAIASRKKASTSVASSLQFQVEEERQHSTSRPSSEKRVSITIPFETKDKSHDSVSSTSQKSAKGRGLPTPPPPSQQQQSPPPTPQQQQQQQSSKRNSTSSKPDTRLRRNLRGLDPSSYFYIAWELFVLWPHLLLIFVVPFIVAFMQLDYAAPYISLAFCTIFLIDTGVILVTEREDQNSRKMSLVNSMKRTALTFEFFLYLITCIPYGFFNYLFLSERRAMNLMTLFRVFRLHQLLNSNSLSKVLKWTQLTVRVNSSTMSIISTFFGIMVMVHIRACAFMFIEGQVGFSDTWWNTDVVQSRLSGQPPQEMPLWDSYTFALWNVIADLFAVTATFWPTSMAMEWTFIVLVTLGALMSAAFIGTVTAVFSTQAQTITSLYIQKMDEVSEYAIEKQLPEQLRTVVTLSFNAKFEGKIFNEQKILEGLNHSLRQEIILSNCRHILQNISFLNMEDELKNSFWMSKLVPLLKEEVFISGEVVFEQGSPGTCMYMITSGVAAIYLDGHRVGFLEEGSYFGELALFALKSIRLCTIRAVTRVMKCVSIDRYRIEPLLQEFPDIEDKLNQALSRKFEEEEFDFDSQKDNDEYDDEEVDDPYYN